MTFEEKAEKWIAEKFAGFPYQQTALHSIEWCRQETLREVDPIIETAIDELRLFDRYGIVELLMRMRSKLEAEREPLNKD